MLAPSSYGSHDLGNRMDDETSICDLLSQRHSMNAMVRFQGPKVTILVGPHRTSNNLAS